MKTGGRQPYISIYHRNTHRPDNDHQLITVLASTQCMACIHADNSNHQTSYDKLPMLSVNLLFDAHCCHISTAMCQSGLSHRL